MRDPVKSVFIEEMNHFSKVRNLTADFSVVDLVREASQNNPENPDAPDKNQGEKGSNDPQDE